MKQVIQYKDDGRIEIVEVPRPRIGPKQVRIVTAASAISVGTERSSVQLAEKSLIGKARSRPDLVRKSVEMARRDGLQATLRTVRTRLSEASPMGYSISGRVEAVGSEVPDIAVGDFVAAGGVGYANHAEVAAVPFQLVVPVPPTVSAEDAAFTTIGAIALQGVREAEPLLGETFLVLGLGLVGQLTVQILRANGCRVIATDLKESLVERAEGFGALGIRPGIEIVSAIRHYTDGIGVDGVLITAATESSQPIELAAELTRQRGRVVVVGAVGLSLPREPFYMKEIALRISRSYGPGRYDRSYEENGLDYPISYVRFTERRNMQTFVELMASGAVKVAPLVTHRFTLDEAGGAYALLKSGSEPYLGVVLTYPVRHAIAAPIPLAPKHPAAPGSIGVSFIGVGNYASANLLPPLVKRAGVSLRTVVSNTGLTARDAGSRFGFSRCSETVEDALGADTQVVFIATRHDSHAALTLATLKAGKHVFVEKPLCLEPADVTEIVAAAAVAPGHLLVGYNRRFAPMTREVVTFLCRSSGPTVVSLRVNAGRIEPGGWITDPKVGGGRIIGELCHFVDLACALTSSLPRSVFARALKTLATDPVAIEDVAVTLTMENGSIATLLYTASGASRMGKEYIEAFRGGRSAIVQDFTETRFFEGGSERHSRGRRDKGQSAMIGAFLDSLTGPTPLVSPVELGRISMATFAVHQSLTEAREIVLDDEADPPGAIQ